MTRNLRHPVAAINGFGRIGRAIFRANHANPRLNIIAINDVNPDIGNVAYQLKYDSISGRFPGTVNVEDNSIIVSKKSVAIFNEKNMADVPWADLGVDVLIDSSGVFSNVASASQIVASGVSKVVVTHSPNNVDQTIILGVNEHEYDAANHHVISSSICDAVSAAPLLKLLDKKIGIESGFLTTLHPYLNYQNLLDGPSESWSWPGHIYHHYAVGRSSVGTLIPKPTSATDAIAKVLPSLQTRLRSTSFRIPTPVVGAANLSLQLERDSSVEEVHRLITDAIKVQRWPVFEFNMEPLISVDFAGSDCSINFDGRWTEFASPRHIYMVFWYDNEWGYSNRAIDVAAFVVGGDKHAVEIIKLPTGEKL